MKKVPAIVAYGLIGSASILALFHLVEEAQLSSATPTPAPGSSPQGGGE